jgi:tetratricopeptide (TPR) repeat protein
MKAEIKEILDYMEVGEEILRLREQVKNLDAQEDPAALQGVMDSLHILAETQDAVHLGYYHLFLGCACHEQKEYREATTHLKQALLKLRGSKNNKAVAHWLLSTNYASSKEFDKARKELIKAERLSKARINAMQEKINFKIRDMFDDPIFAEVLPDPNPKVLHNAEAVVLNADAPPLEKENRPV